MTMNLLLITNLFPTPSDPERGIFTLQLVKRLEKICNVTVVCPLPYFPKLSIFKKFDKWYQFALVPDEYIIDGIKVYSPKYPMIPKLSESNHALLMSIGLKSSIKKLNDKYNFDAVNSQWLFPDSCAVDMAIKSLNIPHIATGLGCDINQDTYHDVKGPLILKMLNRATAITVVSNNLKNELINHKINSDKITVIPNGVDIDSFKIQDKNMCRERLGIKSLEPMVLYVGRLSEEKNIKSLIIAAEKLITKGNSFNLYIVGDGPLDAELKALSKQLKIEKHVHFVGKVDHSEISTWMSSTDFFSLPSIREGCPNVILEALGCGRPVISSNVGAIPDVVNEQSGILFDPNNIEEIVSSFMQAFSRSWDEVKITDSIKKLTWENAAKNYLAVCENAQKQNNSTD